jgi:hypothetical protein
MATGITRAFGAMGRLLRVVGLLTLVGLGGAALYTHSKGNIVASIYRERLRAVTEDYRELRGLYNQVVKKTAVTELVLRDGELRVVVRTAEGVLKDIPTGLDPRREIHVEYVARDGRLWIRRVYTLTDPDSGGRADALVVTVDPGLRDPPWAKDADLQGLSVFRKDLSEGRWVVTTTGNAALALTKLAPGESSDLAGPPRVRDYRQIEREIQGEIDRLTATDVLERLFAAE